MMQVKFPWGARENCRVQALAADNLIQLLPSSPVSLASDGIDNHTGLFNYTQALAEVSP